MVMSVPARTAEWRFVYNPEKLPPEAPGGPYPIGELELFDLHVGRDALGLDAPARRGEVPRDGELERGLVLGYVG